MKINKERKAQKAERKKKSKIKWKMFRKIGGCKEKSRYSGTNNIDDRDSGEVKSK